ncbi:fimbria/pilus periplasmic chaperone [Providencia rettgeri]|nr:fimbria/pilus periplasmic chaperone [Providencia rettgeri]
MNQYIILIREIPPRSDKANTLQLALQTRIKLLYTHLSFQLRMISIIHGKKISFKTARG